MPMRSLRWIALLPVAVASLASAQGGLMGSLLPNVGSTGAGNAAGVLGYCVKNKYLGGTNATSVIGKLTGKQGVIGSSAYADGQKGLLRTKDNAFSLDSVKGKVKSKVCDMVLQHATSLL